VVAVFMGEKLNLSHRRSDPAASVGARGGQGGGEGPLSEMDWA